MEKTTWRQYIDQWDDAESEIDSILYDERDSTIKRREAELVTLGGVGHDEPITVVEDSRIEFVPGEGVWVKVGEEEFTFYRDGKQVVKWYVSCRGSQYILDAWVGKVKYRATDSRRLYKTS